MKILDKIFFWRKLKRIMEIRSSRKFYESLSEGDRETFDKVEKSLENFIKFMNSKYGNLYNKHTL